MKCRVCHKDVQKSVYAEFLSLLAIEIDRLVAYLCTSMCFSNHSVLLRSRVFLCRTWRKRFPEIEVLP